jgi:transcription elongation factor Elf1
MSKPKKGLFLSWEDPLSGLLNADSTEVAPKPVEKPKLRKFKACPNCNVKNWTEVTDHERYRDPFLECNACKATFRNNYKPLDLEFAWRDGIAMPKEINEQYKDKSYEEISEMFVLEITKEPRARRIRRKEV